MTATSRVSFQIGCWPPARSMMLSRRMPSANPGARASPVRNPSSSGPRGSIAPASARTRDDASWLPDAKATPQIPHTLLLDLRSGKEGVLAQVEAGNSQTAVGVPRQHCTQQQKEEQRRHAQRQIKKGLSFEIPAHRVFPNSGKERGHHYGHEQEVHASPRYTKDEVPLRQQSNHSSATNFALRALLNASLLYSASISRTGPSHPRRAVPALQPAVSRACSSGSKTTALIARASAEASCGTTSPAVLAKIGAMPHCSVTTTGVPAATDSAAVLPKFSFWDGSTKTSASRYAAHFASPKTARAKCTCELAPSC